MNFSPEQMKMASSMLNNMSDDQISSMMQNAGFGGMDPSMLRNASKMFGNGGMPNFQN